MQYIRYHEMEDLLKRYRDLECTVESIGLELGEVVKAVDGDNVNDYIESMSLKTSTLDQIKTNSVGHISDKTSSTALNYIEILEKENTEILEQLKHELFLFKLVLDKLSIGLRVLSEETKQVLAFKYFDNLTWYQIEDKLLISKNQGQELRKKGIERLRSVSRITINQYKQIMKILDLK